MWATCPRSDLWFQDPSSLFRKLSPGTQKWSFVLLSVKYHFLNLASKPFFCRKIVLFSPGQCLWRYHPGRYSGFPWATSPRSNEYEDFRRYRFNFNPSVFSTYDCSVYIDMIHLLQYCGFDVHLYTDADIRLARRIRRDTVERGRDVTSVLEQVFETLVPL